MEVKGDEFIRNLEIEKEKVKLKEETESLNSKKQQTIFKSSTITNNVQDNSNYRELDDIKLSRDSNNKQKYIIFAFALILLFLITIITIKLLQEPKTNDDFSSSEIITDNKIEQSSSNTKKINTSLDIDKISLPEETFEPIEGKEVQTQKNTTNDLFEIDKPKKDNIIIDKPKKVVKIKDLYKEKKSTVKETTKTIEIKTIDRKNQKIKKSTIKEINLNKKLYKNNWYIQVGAFSKKPDNKIINTLRKANYTYITKKIKVKNRIFTKLLVGGYKSKLAAKKELAKVRKIIHNPSSYILRIK